MFFLKFCFVIFLSVITKVLSESILAHTGGLSFGNFYEWDECPIGSFANGFEVKADEEEKDFSDQEGMTGLRLRCANKDNEEVEMISSYNNYAGTWKGMKRCPPGEWLTGFRMRIQEYGWWIRDDTAANNIEMKCNGSRIYNGGGNSRGSWREWNHCHEGDVICGLRTRVEDVFTADRVGLVSVLFHCCTLDLEETPPTEYTNSWTPLFNFRTPGKEDEFTRNPDDEDNDNDDDDDNNDDGDDGYDSSSGPRANSPSIGSQTFISTRSWSSDSTDSRFPFFPESHTSDSSQRHSSFSTESHSLPSVSFQSSESPESRFSDSMNPESSIVNAGSELYPKSQSSDSTEPYPFSFRSSDSSRSMSSDSTQDLPYQPSVSYGPEEPTTLRPSLSTDSHLSASVESQTSSLFPQLTDSNVFQPSGSTDSHSPDSVNSHFLPSDFPNSQSSGSDSPELQFLTTNMPSSNSTEKEIIFPNQLTPLGLPFTMYPSDETDYDRNGNTEKANFPSSDIFGNGNIPESEVNFRNGSTTEMPSNSTYRDRFFPDVLTPLGIPVTVNPVDETDNNGNGYTENSIFPPSVLFGDGNSKNGSSTEMPGNSSEKEIIFPDHLTPLGLPITINPFYESENDRNGSTEKTNFPSTDIFGNPNILESEVSDFNNPHMSTTTPNPSSFDDKSVTMTPMGKPFTAHDDDSTTMTGDESFSRSTSYSVFSNLNPFEGRIGGGNNNFNESTKRENNWPGSETNWKTTPQNFETSTTENKFFSPSFKPPSVYGNNGSENETKTEGKGEEEDDTIVPFGLDPGDEDSKSHNPEKYPPSGAPVDDPNFNSINNTGVNLNDIFFGPKKDEDEISTDPFNRTNVPRVESAREGKSYQGFLAQRGEKNMTNPNLAIFVMLGLAVTAAVALSLMGLGYYIKKRKRKMSIDPRYKYVISVRQVKPIDPIVSE